MLGSVLLAPDCLTKCAQELKAGADVFYDLRHKAIYEAMVEMDGRGEPIEVITLQQRLKDRNILEQVGGIPYLNALIDATPSAANLTYYTGIVSEKHALRRMAAFCRDYSERVYTHEGGLDELLDQMERDAMAVRRFTRTAPRRTIREVTTAAIVRIEEKFQRQGALAGIATGFPDLDKVLDGLCPGNLIVPSAFTSGGKTSLAMNWVEHAVFDLKLPAAVVSLEMTAEELAVRALCSSGRVNLRDIGAGRMEEADFPKLTSAAGRLAGSGLHILDDVDSLGAICAELRRLKQEHDIRLAVVDYIQLVFNDRAPKGANREQEVGGVAAALKALAKELGIPVVAPSQLNDDGALRESKAIGMHADVVLAIEPKVEEGDEDRYVDAEPVDVLVRKNRNGPRGVRVRLTFLKKWTRFESAAKVSDEDVPPEG